MTKLRNSKKPDQSVNISKAAGFITGNASAFDGSTSLEIWSKPKMNITLSITASPFLDTEGLIISAFDMAVCDAVFTLYSRGITEVTAEMICRELTGRVRDRVTEKLVSLVMKSIEKMRHIDISIECTDLFLKKTIVTKEDLNDYPNRKIFLTSYLLPLEILEAVNTGNQKDYKKGYRIIKEPSLYTIARILNNIADIPQGMFEACRKIQDTEEVILIKRYVFKRICGMQNKRNKLVSGTISYQWHDNNTNSEKGMLNALGYCKEHYVNWKKKRNTIHCTVKTILECLKQKGFIDDYEEERYDKQTIKGFRITCSS